MRVLVTGANGFIGSALCPALNEAGSEVRRAVRRAVAVKSSLEAPVVEVGEINGATDWMAALAGIDCVVHLAASGADRVVGTDPLAACRTVNEEGSHRLAQQAAAAGVRRLVFMSSIKVNGEATFGRPFTEDNPPQPQDVYGQSKWEAERATCAIGRETGLEVAILRPPLVYGPGVRGNFLRLIKLVARGWPLPLASVRNLRSIIYVGNLVDAVRACLLAPGAAGRTYVVSDGADVSTPELMRALAKALGVTPRLFAFPPPLLMLGATILGKREEATRVLGSLQLDSSRIQRELGWKPPHTMEEGLGETARWFLRAVSRDQ